MANSCLPGWAGMHVVFVCYPSEMMLFYVRTRISTLVGYYAEQLID